MTELTGPWNTGNLCLWVSLPMILDPHSMSTREIALIEHWGGKLIFGCDDIGLCKAAVSHVRVQVWA